MIRLRTLGATGLADASGAELAGILRQPKRFALLAYLALSRPAGLQRRDALLPLFWPELDADRARAALRQSLYNLRRQLPVGALLTRGDEEVGVDPAIWCDAWAFEAALAAGRPADALTLYGGELLAGFHLSDAAPEFGYWLDSERQRLRDLAVAGSWDLAERSAIAGDLDGIRQWATHAVGLAPLDEDGARRLVAMLDGAGDRAGAVAAYEQWARRLRDELEVDPAPETEALVESIRRRSDARPVGRREPRAASGGAQSEEEPSPSARGAAAVRGSRDRPPRRVQVAGGLVVTGLVAVLVALLPFEVSWRTGTAAPSTARVVVLPFAVQGSPDLDFLRDGLVYLLSAGIDGPDIRAIDPHSVLQTAGSPSLAADPAALSNRFGAGFYVRGNVVGGDAGLRITAAVYSRAGDTPLGQAVVSGPASDLLALTDRLTIDLLTSWRGATGPTAVQVAALGTGSVPALKAYLRGERYLRESQPDLALAAFREAVREDTLFALAYYRMSLAGSWGFRGELATWAAEQALRHSDRLPQRERLLLEAHSAYRAGLGAEAEQLAERLTILYPEDPEAWYRLGEAIHHLGPLRGRPLSAAAESFGRAAALDLLSPESLYHLVQINALLGDTSAARRHARTALTASPSGARTPQLLVLDALLSGTRGTWGDLLAELASEDDFTIVSAAYSAGVFAGDLHRAREVAALLTSSSRTPDTRAFGHLLVASLELSLGRWEAARSNLGALRALDARRGDDALALLGTAPATPLTDRELRELQARLWEDPAPAPASGWWAQAPELRWLPRWYARARVAERLQDEAHRDALLAQLPALTRDTALIADLSAGITSGFAYGRGEPLPSIPLPGPLRAGIRSEHSVLSGSLSQPARRQLQAALLAGRGQEREALDWYESLSAYSLSDLVHGVPALVERARLHERLGEREQAAALYHRFLTAWSHADPELQPMVAEAREGLRRVAPGSR
jgi:DNA-binding SARP family transcriptional activator/TolB-like protein